VQAAIEPVQRRFGHGQQALNGRSFEQSGRRFDCTGYRFASHGFPLGLRTSSLVPNFQFKTALRAFVWPQWPLMALLDELIARLRVINLEELLGGAHTEVAAQHRHRQGRILENPQPLAHVGVRTLYCLAYRPVAPPRAGKRVRNPRMKRPPAA